MTRRRAVAKRLRVGGKRIPKSRNPGQTMLGKFAWDLWDLTNDPETFTTQLEAMWERLVESGDFPAVVKALGLMQALAEAATIGLGSTKPACSSRTVEDEADASGGAREGAE